jgi:TolA-binding protein
VRHWLLSKAKADDLKTFDAKTTMLGLLIASELSELVAWSNLAQHLAITDQTGQTTSDTLSQLQLQEKASDAEQLAIQFIAPDAEHPVTTAAREAACRWAGRTSRWSMLAIASESQDLTAADPTRTLAVERLFAESLTQTGRTKDAHQWWVYLADVRSAKDFGTLIRCAETETAFGKSSSKAGERIAAARQAAGEENSSLRLVSMLESEVAIRRSDFDQARSLLEQVVRSTDAAGGLRGRAQWLIGETWYMQRKFTKAIDSYRKVEQIDTSGRWVAASFLQAGKSFEQMGRTKEATLCYGTLLSRFADTEYAVPAQRRLAAMSPGNNPTNPSTTQPTIRR